MGGGREPRNRFAGTVKKMTIFDGEITYRKYRERASQLSFALSIYKSFYFKSLKNGQGYFSSGWAPPLYLPYQQPKSQLILYYLCCACYAITKTLSHKQRRHPSSTRPFSNAQRSSAGPQQRASGRQESLSKYFTASGSVSRGSTRKICFQVSLIAGFTSRLSLWLPLGRGRSSRGLTVARIRSFLPEAPSTVFFSCLCSSRSSCWISYSSRRFLRSIYMITAPELPLPLLLAINSNLLRSNIDCG